jgi:hypothetical protein
MAQSCQRRSKANVRFGDRLGQRRIVTLSSRRGDAGTLTNPAEVLGFLRPAAVLVIQCGATVGKGRDRRSVGFCCRRRSRLRNPETPTWTGPVLAGPQDSRSGSTRFSRGTPSIGSQAFTLPISERVMRERPVDRYQYRGFRYRARCGSARRRGRLASSPLRKRHDGTSR